MAEKSQHSAHGQQTAHMATTTVKVDGMTCATCTSAVESAFKDVDGAGAVSVSLVMGRAVVHHDPQKLTAEQITEMIEDRGFDAEVLSTNLPSRPEPPSIALSIPNEKGSGPQPTTTTLSVQGMTCGACTSSIEAGFHGVAGVNHVTVALLSERAVVEHDADVISPDQLVEIIEDRGFDASIIETKTANDRSTLSQSVAPIGEETLVTTVAIEGMTCGACTSAVEGAFKNVQGMIKFNISLLAERAVISHNPLQLSTEKIVELIDDAGFEARIVSTKSESTQSGPSSGTARLKIYGLSNALAATALETVLRSRPGVESALVNLSTSRATVNYTSSLVGLRAIVEIIENAGYNALVAEADDNNAQLESLAKTKEIQEWKKAFLFSVSFAIPVFTISMIIPMFIPILNFGAWRIIPGLYLGDLICGILTVPVQFGIGKRFYISAWKSLKHKSPTMDVLVVLGTSAAFFFSCFAVIIAILMPPHNKPGTVFDTSTMLLTFITLGRWLENRAKGQTSKALSNLMSLAPSMATIYQDPLLAEKLAETWSAPNSPVHTRSNSFIDDKGPPEIQASNEKMIPTELIEVGDIVILRPGDRVPADGTVTRGESYVDESMVTGEPMPFLKKKNGLLMAGTVNGAGRLDFRVTRAGKDTQLSQIVNLVQEAQTSRAPIQRMADLVAGYFVPIIILLGLITFVGWMVLSHILPHPPRIFLDEQSGGKFMVCLQLCISVIVFACPCALGLATPTAVMVGTGAASQQGILVKGGAALETATRITHIVLDKTGTLTMGKLSVSETRIEPTWTTSEWRKTLWWSLVGLAEIGSEHPIGRAIVATAKGHLRLEQENAIAGNVGNFKAAVGRGVTATIEPASSTDQARYEVVVGNAAFLRNRKVDLPSSAEPEEPSTKSTYNSDSATSTGLTLIHIAINNTYAGTLGLSDTLKPTAPAAIAAFHRMGISTSLVTGDTYPTALAVAQLVGIPSDSIHASVSPAEKQTIISDLQSQGEIVAMVGDGINDSPALATANIGIGLVSGSDIAVEAADIVIMRPDDLLNIPAALCLCRTIFRRIKVNLLWACGYNFVGLPFAMGLFLPFGFHMPPMLAAAAMAASSVRLHPL